MIKYPCQKPYVAKLQWNNDQKKKKNTQRLKEASSSSVPPNHCLIVCVSIELHEVRLQSAFGRLHILPLMGLNKDLPHHHYRHVTVFKLL